MLTVRLPSEGYQHGPPLWVFRGKKFGRLRRLSCSALVSPYRASLEFRLFSRLNSLRERESCRMLTTARAWMRASQGHGHGFSGDLERIDQCSKSRRRKLLMRRAPAMHLRDEVAKQNVELWYSRKRKKKKNAISVAAEESEMARKVDMDSTPCVCSDCGTSRTPLWRRGPAGPKSLCNACGIRYRKTKKTTSASKEEKISRKREALWLLMEESGKLELPCGKEAVEAAMLLMAMSSGLLSVL